MKQQQNPMSRQGEIANFWLKNVPKDFCHNFKYVVTVKDFKYSLLKILAKSYEQIGRNWPKCNFLGQNGHFFSKMGQKMGKNYFSQNFNQVIIVKDHK